MDGEFTDVLQENTEFWCRKSSA